MKDYLSPLATLLVAASFNSASATDESSAESKFTAALLTISKSVENFESLDDNEWASQLTCTADLTSQQPSLLDENACSTTTDSGGQACIWCDATESIGSGLCVSPDQKTMLSGYWDQLCGASKVDPPGVSPTPPIPVPVVPVTPPPTPNPTPNPTNPVPAPAPDSNDVLGCAMDAANAPITDEATCVSKNTAGSSCAWCKIPIIGGSCITSDMKSQLGMLCSSSETQKEGNLRGDDGNGGFKNLDPSCLVDKDSCGSKKDSNGGACTWCDAANVFGICASSSQKDYFGRYMNCADPAAASETPVAVE